ncbi:MAG: hypothetical protein DIU83_10780, partial [Bacillota bacterium]
MRIAVLGTGLIGRMIVRELARSSSFSEVVAVDGSPEAAVSAAAEASQAAEAWRTTAETSSVAGDAGRPAVRGVTADLGDYGTLVALLRQVDIAIAALPDSLSFLANQAAIN